MPTLKKLCKMLYGFESGIQYDIDSFFRGACREAMTSLTIAPTFDSLDPESDTIDHNLSHTRSEIWHD